jgi:Alginate lyase
MTNGREVCLHGLKMKCFGADVCLSGVLMVVCLTALGCGTNTVAENDGGSRGPDGSVQLTPDAAVPSPGSTDAGADSGASVDAGSGSPSDAGPGADGGQRLKYPAQLLDLSNWKITLPIDSKGQTSGRAVEVTQPKLATFESKPWFTLNDAQTAVVFRANHGGATTSGSGNPRSELREMDATGLKPASWSSTSGRHTLWIRQAITALTKTKPHTVAGQIHDGEDDVTVFRLEGKNLYITDGNNTKAKLLANDYVLGTVFTVKFIVEGGVVTYEYNEQPVANYQQSKKGSGWYFKVGDYTQSNPSTATDDDAAYAEVQVFDFKVEHKP